MAIKSRYYPLILFSASVFFVFFPAQIYLVGAAEIAYLPRNEDMFGIEKSYDANEKILGEVSCPAAADLFQEAAECLYCVQELKPLCPDCCLVLEPQRAMRCSADDLTDDYGMGAANYACGSAAFSGGDCPAMVSAAECANLATLTCPDPSSPPATPGCQRKGCASTKPTGNCVWDNPTNSWLCEEDNLGPEFLGCPPIAASGLQNCASLASYYTEPIESVACPMALPGPNCYKYTPTAEFSSCVQGCQNYTDDFEECQNRVLCCKERDCDPLGQIHDCNGEACGQRVNFPECDDYNVESCTTLQQGAMNCLLGGTCGGCFQEIDPSFNYRLVARSSDAVTIIWQLDTRWIEMAAVNPPAYLFTKVKIFDEGSGTLVHESMIHQKYLQAYFSIFCATHVEKGVLEQGKPYLVKLYYFLPVSAEIPGVTAPAAGGIQVEVRNMRLIVVRTRE